MSHYVLVHGAWHGGWCWHKLAGELRSRGHEVAAPDLPGHGEDTTPRPGVGLQDYADRIVETLRAVEAPAILVGHSLGGLSISVAAETEPDRVAGLIYLCAFVPEDGLSANQLAGKYNRESALNGSIVTGPEPDTTVVRAEAVVEAFYADCSDADVDFARAHLVPQPARALLDPIPLSEARFGRVRKAYVECLADRAIPIDAQRAMARNAGIERVITLDTGHSPFLSQPAALADALESLT